MSPTAGLTKMEGTPSPGENVAPSAGVWLVSTMSGNLKCSKRIPWLSSYRPGLFATSCLVSQDASVASDKDNHTPNGLSKKGIYYWCDSPRLKGHLVVTLLSSHPLSPCVHSESAHLHQTSCSEALPLGTWWLCGSRPHLFSPSNLRGKDIRPLF